MAYNITKEQMLAAIQNSQGLISKIQSHLKGTLGKKIAWETVEKYVNKWQETKDAVKAEQEQMLDIAESNIHQALVQKDLATSKWYLKMKGQERGYIDQPTIKLDNDEPLNINFSGKKLSAEELKACSTVEVPNYDEEE